MIFKKIKKIMGRLRSFPIHPQWFVYRNDKFCRSEIGRQAHGLVLDIGCADQYIRDNLKRDTEYIGLDYYQTAMHWYSTRPDIYGDAQSLPFPDSSVDSVLLLDVLEHLSSPEVCFSEIYRVLKPSGIFVLKVPFLYPIHDAPLDFHRWTRFGLRDLAERYGFNPLDERHLGNPMETAGLMVNVAISRTVLKWIERKNPMAILCLLLPLVIVVVNCTCWFLDKLSSADEIMPHGYQLVLKKL